MVQQFRSMELEAGPRALEFLLSEGPGNISRENVIFAGGARVLPGMVVGQLLVDTAPAVTPGSGNGGDGTFTLLAGNGNAVGPGVMAGGYTVTILGGTHSAGAPELHHVPGTTSGGDLTLASPAFAADAVDGTWIVECVASAAGGGTFNVINPDGQIDGVAVEGAAYTGRLKFQIDAAAADFVAGDYFTVELSPAVPANGLGTFEVRNPDGVVVGTGVVGTPFTGPINFTAADGGQNFEPGDTWTVSVAIGENTFAPLTPGAVDGSAVVAGIAGYLYRADGDGTPTGQPMDGIIIARQATVKKDLLIWPDHAGPEVILPGIAALKAMTIIVR